MLIYFLFYQINLVQSGNNSGPLSKLFVDTEEGEPSTSPSPSPTPAATANTTTTTITILTDTTSTPSKENTTSGPRSGVSFEVPDSPGFSSKQPITRGMKKKKLSRRDGSAVAADASISFVKQMSENVNVETGINKPVIT